MRRVVSLFLPHLATDLVRRRSSTASGPLVTSWHDGRKLVVGSACAEAEAIGLRVGLPIAEARARVPGLRIVPADPAGDAASLRRIARLCLRHAPLTAPAPPDGVMIDATGCAHLFGGERRMLADIVRGVAARGIEARAAIAGTPGAAHAVARFTGGPDAARFAGGAPAVAIVAPGDEAETLAPLPVDALRLDGELCRTLRRLGLDTVVSLARLPRASLARRFGPALLERLDQAMGRIAEPIGPEPAARPIAARLGFLEPLLTAEAFAVAIGRLVDDVAGTLESAGIGARRLELGFERVDRSRQLVQVATARPVRDRMALRRLLGSRLETVDPGLGVEAMWLAVRRSEAVRAHQYDAPSLGRPGFAGTLGFRDEANDARVFPLVDQLTNRLGGGRVWGVVAVESHVPERSVADAAPLAAHAPPVAPTSPRTRPVRLLDPPQPIAVTALLPDHPPASFVWRRVRHRVRHADGPERIAGEWWRRPGEVCALRDYFRVEDDEGRRFWLFRRGNGTDPETGDMRWFLHGLF